MKVNELDELEFSALRPKAHSYLRDDNEENKTGKKTLMS